MATRSDATPWINSRPPASHLVLLSELSGIQPGTKVRFIGCVNKYDAPTATLHLVDKYAPQRDLGRAQSVKGSKQQKSWNVGCHEIMLDVKLVLLPATSRQLFRVGSWITVLGYIAFPASGNKDGTSRTRGDCAEVQALLMSACGSGGSSGGMQNERYAKALEARRKAMRSMEKAGSAHDGGRKMG